MSLVGERRRRARGTRRVSTLWAFAAGVIVGAVVASWVVFETWLRTAKPRVIVNVDVAEGYAVVKQRHGMEASRN